MNNFLNVFMPILISTVFLGSLVWQLSPSILYFLGFLKKEQKRSILYNASVTENGIPANKVFETLRESRTKPNYLGIEGEKY